MRILRRAASSCAAFAGPRSILRSPPPVDDEGDDAEDGSPEILVGVGEVGADDEDKEVEDYVGRAEGEDNGLVDGPEDEKQNFEDVEVEFHIEEGKFSVQVVGKGSCIRRAVE